MFHVKFSYFSFFSDHTTEFDYVKVYAYRKDADPNRPGPGGGCYSGVGRIGQGKQKLNLENKPDHCMRSGTIIHEFNEDTILK